MLAGGEELVQSVFTRPLLLSWKHIVPLSGTVVAEPLDEESDEEIEDHWRSQPQPPGPVWLATVYFSSVPVGLYAVSTQLYVHWALSGCGKKSSAAAFVTASSS